MRVFLSTLIFTIAFYSGMEGQTFGAAITLGGNAAQIDGDELAGYHKLGLNGGIRGTASLGGRWDLSLELLYSERGSSTYNAVSGPQLRREINLSYFELPVLVSVKDWLVADNRGDYYRVRAFAGLSYARLISASVYDDNSASGYNDELAAAFNSNDIAGIVGIGYTAFRNWEVSARYTRSFVKIYDTSGDSPPLIPLSLVGYYISFNIAYLIY